MTHTWEDLPDPRPENCPGGTRCQVDLPEHRWSHIRPHVDRPDEPWDDWLVDWLAGELRATYLPGMSLEQQQEVRQRVSDRMNEAVRECLGVPLAVVYDVLQPGQFASALTVDLVLRCGAKLCIRERERGHYAVSTCYFHRCVQGRPPERRWRWLMRHLILRYARHNGNDTYSPPDASWGVQSHDETSETMANPRFRTNTRWGLDRPIADPWFGITDPWPPPPPPPPPRVSLRRPGRY